jgi:hypothetical protein
MSEVKEKKHQYATELITDTETTVRYSSESRTVYVRVRCLPGLARWTQPPAAITRKWVDEILEGTGMKRTGKRVHSSGWNYLYYLTEDS